MRENENEVSEETRLKIQNEFMNSEAFRAYVQEKVAQEVLAECRWWLKFNAHSHMINERRQQVEAHYEELKRYAQKKQSC